MTTIFWHTTQNTQYLSNIAARKFLARGNSDISNKMRKRYQRRLSFTNCFLKIKNTLRGNPLEYSSLAELPPAMQVGHNNLLLSCMLSKRHSTFPALQLPILRQTPYRYRFPFPTRNGTFRLTLSQPHSTPLPKSCFIMARISTFPQS